MKVFIGINDLTTLRPDLAREWHPTKNGAFTAEQISTGSFKKVWWLGECGHEWEAIISRRTKGCPICPLKMIPQGTNSLVDVHPKIAAEWHPTKNGELSLEQVGSASRKKVWWLGKCGHEWEAIIRNRTRGTKGCPLCPQSRILSTANDLASINPTVAAEWHPTKNTLNANQVTVGSGIKVWWLGRCGHEWKTAVYSRTIGGGCPICSGQQVLAGYNDLGFTNPNLAAEWHPTKNGNFTPNQITGGSPRKVWWLGNCGHEWESVLSSRVNGCGCPICSGHQVLAGFNDLMTNYPKIASEWHPIKNEIEASQVTARSHKKYWWRCSFGHEWETTVEKRTVRTSGCLVCLNKRVLIGSNDLSTTHPLLSAEWHPTKNGKLQPHEVHGGAHRKVWWLGECGHEWQAQVKARTIGKGCGQCANHVSKAEVQIREFLESLGLTVEISNRTILRGKEIDLWIPEKNTGIEFNGLYWHSEKYRGKDFHYDKWQNSRRAGIQLIQIWEDDWTLKADIIKRMLSAKLRTRATSSKRPVNMNIATINANQAEEFLGENHLKGFASGTYYLGLVDKEDTLQAILVLDREPKNTDEALNIVRYCSRENHDSNFVELLTYTINAYQPESFTVLSDNCEANDEMYKKAGFIEEEAISPDYMYVIRQQRKLEERRCKSDYLIKRFRDDPALIWEESKTEMELADLNGLNRIWDAGKTIYRLSLESEQKRNVNEV